jgi:hypothetical protein
MKDAKTVFVLMGVGFLLATGSAWTEKEAELKTYPLLAIAQLGKQPDFDAQRREEARKAADTERQSRDNESRKQEAQRRENEALRRVQEPTQVEIQRETPLERQQREFQQSQKQTEAQKKSNLGSLNICPEGLVRREAVPGDPVCVTPETRAQVVQDNSVAESRRNPKGAYGPDTCIEGYVWREAVPGDRVCVRPETKAQAARDNSEAGKNIQR